MEGIFVIGCDTGVGKTVVSALLLRWACKRRKAFYWKPVQTGTREGDDTTEVKELTGFSREHFLDAGYRLKEPLSPHLAAEQEGVRIDIDELARMFSTRVERDSFVIVEAAGGLLVPYAKGVLQTGFIRRLNLPAVLVVEDRLGAINQALLTIHAARELGVNVVGVAMNKASGKFGNAEAIAAFGGVPVKITLPAYNNRSEMMQGLILKERELDEGLAF